jgi:hypothetical protein
MTVAVPRWVPSYVLYQVYAANLTTGLYQQAIYIYIYIYSIFCMKSTVMIHTCSIKQATARENSDSHDSEYEVQESSGIYCGVVK